MADDGDTINGWISRIMGPAKHLLSDGATRFLPTLFSPSLFPQEIQSPNLSAPPISVAGNLNPDSSNTVGMDITRDHSDGAVPDIEQLIKGKTFSTKEIDHLIKILHSRAQTEETDTFQLASSTPLQKPSLQSEIGAKPVDIARAYMGSRTSQAGLTSARLSSKPCVRKAPICWPGAVTRNQEGNSTIQDQKRRYGRHSLYPTPYSRTMYSKSKSSSAARAKESPLVRGNHRSPFAKELNNAKLQSSENGIHSVHSHSSKVVRQILEHIDRPVTLKEKSMELKLATSSKKQSS